LSFVTCHSSLLKTLAKSPATVYVCQSCGNQSRKWLGKCPDCGEWNSFVEERSRAAATTKGTARGSFQLREVQPVAYDAIESQDDSRITSGVPEFDRVLGGGIVPGSLILIGGDPGIGKSTLLLQVADKLSGTGEAVLYISGEESERQIKLRGERLGVEAKNLYLLPETNLENIFHEIEKLGPGAIIVDSIQTVYSGKIESAPGSVSQVREVAGQFLLLAKNRNLPVFLIGHVTKEGSIAGPKALEHIVDTVLYFEGERHHNHRIVRATKNRFGAANEVGVFEMTGAGLVAVANPSEMFLQERPIGVAGSVVNACIEGTRPVLVEVQALVSSSKYGTGRRMTQGFDSNRVALLIAMLEKRVGFHLIGDDVFVNIAGGLEIDEPAADLGVVASIASSFKNAPIDAQTVVFGEVGLTGEVRGAMQAQVRAREAQALGFKKIIMPASNTTGLERLLGVRVVGVRSVEEALDELF
jgi:DNA repair protein RadA/Sms